MDGGFVLLFILAFGVLLGLNGLLAGNASDIAQEKGYEKKKWFHMCFWLGIFSYLMICAMPDKKLRQQNEEMLRLQQETVSRLGDNQPARHEEFELPEL